MGFIRGLIRASFVIAIVVLMNNHRCSASVVYEFHASSDGSVLAWVTVSDSIASPNSPWATNFPLHVESFVLHPSLFPDPMPAGNVVLGSPTSIPGPFQSDGPTITFGRVSWDSPIAGINNITLWGDGNRSGNPAVTDFDNISISGDGIGSSTNGDFVVAVPEPSVTIVLMGLTAFGVVGVRRSRAHRRFAN